MSNRVSRLYDGKNKDINGCEDIASHSVVRKINVSQHEQPGKKVSKGLGGLIETVGILQKTGLPQGETLEQQFIFCAGTSGNSW